MKKLALALLFVLFIPTLTSAQTYTETQHATGLTQPVAMAFAPDGRIFVTEKGGKLRIVKNGALLPTPFLTLSVSTNSERGLLGVTFDPNFAANRYVYVYYTRESFPIKNRLSRFTASATNPDIADAASEKILIDNIASDAGNHNGGAIHFGKDGKLYVAIGDGGQFPSNGPALNTLSGKILRINSDGTVPTDNPFYNTPGALKEIWAVGFRNPFTFAVDPVSGKIYVNDVGRSVWEEVNVLEKGKDYGWPVCEGPQDRGVGFCINLEFKYPIHSYDHSGPGKSITGAVFYKGDYYFGDYVGNFIKKLNSANVVSDFVTAKGPIDMAVGPDNNLYYLSITTGKIFKLTPGTNVVNGQCAVAINACSAGTLNDTADSATHSVWSCVGNNGGSTASCSSPISSNKIPTATITSPVVNAKYNAGQTITMTGTGTDPEDGTLPVSAFTWTVTFHHDTHTHPALGPITGKASDTFVIPTSGELSDNVWYRVTLKVTDSKGATNEVSREIYPNKSVLTFETTPPGFIVTVDDQPKLTPFSITSVVGIVHKVTVSEPQNENDILYVYNQWSDRGARSHDIATPATNTTYTVNLNKIHQSTQLFTPHYGTGNLLTHIQKEIDDRISTNLANLTTKSLWLEKGNGRQGSWTRNPSRWTTAVRSLDWSGVSPWNNQNQYRRGATLISPRHVIMAKHFEIAAKRELIFVANDGTVVTRTIQAIEQIPGTDISVGLLDNTVPDYITFYPVISRATWESYLKNADPTTDIPIIMFDQDDLITVRTTKAGRLYNAAINMLHDKPADAKRLSFAEDVVSGDSGDPFFVVIGGVPVLLSAHFDFVLGPNLATHFNAVNAAMTKLGGGYQLSTIDLSRFTPATPNAPTKFTLTITKPTNGTITSGTAINCGVNGNICTAQYDLNASVSLTATAATGYTFAGWGGACTGTAACSVAMSASKTLTASFTIINTAPRANNGSFTVVNTVNGTADIQLTATDDQISDTLSFTPSTLTLPNGTLTKTGEGRYTYRVTTQPSTNVTDTFKFTASDGKLTSNEATVTINIPKYIAPIVQVPNLSGLAGYWRLDNLVGTDISGVNNTATVESPLKSVTGKVGNAIGFDASNVGKALITKNIFGANQWSVSLWINPVYPIPNATPYFGVYTLVSGDDYTKLLGIRADGVYLYDKKAASYNFNANRGWKNLVVTYDGTKLTTFIDKVNMGSYVTSNPMAQAVVRRFGSITGANSLPFQGAIDEIKMYTLVLSNAEIAAHYDSIVPPVADTDGDGVANTADKCPNTQLALKNQVNRAGCVRPKVTKFNTKPVVEDDITAVSNVELGVNNVGTIKFNTPVKLTRDNAVIDIDTNVIIEQDKVEIKSSVVPELNKPATITLYNISETNPRIMKDGAVCLEPQCKIDSFINGTLTFTVTGFSVYTVEETPTTPEEPAPAPETPRRRGGGGGGGSSQPRTLTNDELIAQLTAQLNILIAQLNALTGGSMAPMTNGALTKTLSIGSRDVEVKTLQQLLNKKGIIVPTTGYYGAQTQAAVRKFQAQNGITQTGSVGPLTRGKLNQ